MAATGNVSPLPGEPRGRVLLVDDEEPLVRAISRALVKNGYDVTTAPDGVQATKRLDEGVFDLVMSDIAMPGMGGIELLRAVRQRDLDVPVILMTGSPTVDTATQAIQLGVLGYLVKPFPMPEVIAAADRAIQINRLARIKREAFEYLNRSGDWIGDRAGLEVNFASAMETMWMAYQPIVCWSRKEVFAHEALVRPIHPALPHPGALIGAAEKLGQLHKLGRRLRDMVAEGVEAAPEAREVFVNIHGYDLEDDLLLSAGSPLSRIASRVVLEITERASVNEIKDLGPRIQRLRDLGFRIAVDDLGAGYAGLTSFAQLRPDIVKIDMTLIRDVDKEPTKERLVRSLSELCREMKILAVCEGVETASELETLVKVGYDYFQGYHFARPGRPFPTVKF
jgi:EAL domain-containing protein (putative c-di-GMP-specific phosphodiesterase class I)/ActR/RegA family two-component response regulator